MMSYLGNHWDSRRENKSCSMKRGEKTQIGGDICNVKEVSWAPQLSVHSVGAGWPRVFNKQLVET